MASKEKVKTGIDAMDLHGALSTLLFAVQEEISPYGYSVELRYDRYCYLSVVVETKGKHIERLKAIFNHGVLWGPFQYHFKGVSHGLPVIADEDMTISASVDLSRSKAPSGPIDYNNTPSRQRERQQYYEWGYREVA